mmetsp:Transcript_755/g.1212  ORF Transcript_755/g.1212 Transcript_755/m.1212 type:complete len:83 (-) Transcript_755:499-747(-)
MKSYGEKWSGSRARFSLFREGYESPIWAEELRYYPESKISVTDSHKFDLGESGITVGERGRFEAELIGGQTFKIAGLALCAF